MQITQDSTGIYVSVFNVVTPGRIVGYTPNSVEFYRASTLRTGTWTDSISKSGLVSGTYWFFLYDADDIATDSGSVDVQISAIVNALTLSQDDLNHPENVTVVTTGSGTGTYDVTLNGTYYTTRNMVNGFDIFDVIGMTQGTHTFCVGSVCDSVTVGQPPVLKYSCTDFCQNPSALGTYLTQAECLNNCKYGCADNCQTAGTGGLYSTKTECQTACAPKCPKGDRYLKPIGGSCDPGYSEEWHPFQNECVCDATKAPDWQTSLLYIGGLLAGAYLIGQILNRGRK